MRERRAGGRAALLLGGALEPRRVTESGAPTCSFNAKTQRRRDAETQRAGTVSGVAMTGTAHRPGSTDSIELEPPSLVEPRALLSPPLRGLRLLIDAALVGRPRAL